MDYLCDYLSSDDETPGTPCTVSHSPTPEPQRKTACGSKDDAPRSPAMHIRLPRAGSCGPSLFPPAWQSTLELQPTPSPIQRLAPGSKLHQAWTLLESAGDFKDIEGVLYDCPFCANLARRPKPKRLCPELLTHVVRSHLEHFTCMFCEEYSSSRVDQLGRHRCGTDITQCSKVKELGGAKAYENLYWFLVDNGKNTGDRQLGKLTYRFAALEAKYAQE